MHDERIKSGTLLRGKNSGRCPRVQRIAGQPVNCLGRHSDHLSGAQQRRSLPGRQGNFLRTLRDEPARLHKDSLFARIIYKYMMISYLQSKNPSAGSVPDHPAPGTAR